MLNFAWKIFDQKKNPRYLQNQLQLISTKLLKEDPENAIEPTKSKFEENEEFLKKINEENCTIKNGKITSVDAENIYVDRKFHFEICKIEMMMQHDIKTGRNVKYMTYKPPGDDTPQIVKILEIEHHWDDNSDSSDSSDEDEVVNADIPNLLTEENKTLAYTVREEKLEGLIEIANQKSISIDTELDKMLLVSLDEIKCKYKFHKGDLVTVLTKMQNDPNTFDRTGEILKVLSVEPRRTDKRKLEVTSVLPYGGLIGNNYVYHNSNLKAEYRNLKIGDLVDFQAIESRQEYNNTEYDWRVLEIFSANIKELPKVKINDNQSEPVEPIAQVAVLQSGDAYRHTRNYRNEFNFRPHKWQQYSGNVISGGKTIQAPRFMDIRMKDNSVPSDMRELMMKNLSFTQIEDALYDKFPYLLEPLNGKNARGKLHKMLHLEELAMEAAFRNYDLERAHFSRGSGEEAGFLKLFVKNVAEKRPSIAIGDSVKITSPFDNEPNSKSYEGCIHKVQQDSILLKFHESFHSQYNGEDYRVEFCFSRSNFRKQHHAIEVVYNREHEHFLGPKYFFPEGARSVYPQLDVELDPDENMVARGFTRKYEWFNKKLNREQKQAVVNIMRGEFRPIPYVIFGPPGTGKTMTIVEAIHQLARNIQGSRLIVGTPSNSSANLITELLSQSNQLTGDFIRLVSYNQIEKELIPEHLAVYCRTVDIAHENKTEPSNSRTFKTQSGLEIRAVKKSFVAQKKIIISTLSTLGSLMHIRFKPDQFTHIVLDEAGQCLETETLIPLTFLNKTNGQVVLAGDHKQLGPMVTSKLARKLGYETSFLERILTTFSFYQRDEQFVKYSSHNPKFMTKLLKNYRSLPSIMKVYNELFYLGELQAMISNKNKEAVILSSLDTILPNQMLNANKTDKCGVYFYAVNGRNVRSAESPSWFNPQEATEVFNFYCKLIGKKIKNHDVGIVTPYIQQVKTIRNLIQEAGLSLPKIGTVEEFQGQERDVVLISTVRSANNELVNDMRFGLGFVRSEKRMNVAISRARALVVVFGNHKTLKDDQNWQYLINYTIEKSTYYGKNVVYEKN